MFCSGFVYVQRLPPDHSIGKKLNGWVTRNFSVAPVVLIDKELGQIEYF